jgi:hypothetical protein
MLGLPNENLREHFWLGVSEATIRPFSDENGEDKGRFRPRAFFIPRDRACARRPC